VTNLPPSLSVTQSIDEGKVKKQIKLDSLPEILIVQLARFSFDYYKGIPIKVTFSRYWDNLLSATVGPGPS
jgi:ubiquitin C-terminal hydrolase